MAEAIDDLLKDIDDVLGAKTKIEEPPKEDKDEIGSLMAEIDSVLSPESSIKTQEIELDKTKEIPQAFPAPVPAPVPAPTPKKEPEIDFSKPSNIILSVIGDKDEEQLTLEDINLISTLDPKELYDFSNSRPDITLDDDQQRMLFKYKRESSPYKIPTSSEDWLNLGEAVLDDIGEVGVLTEEIVGSTLKGTAKAAEYGVPYLLGMTTDYAEAKSAEKLLPADKKEEVENWRKRAWQIANTPLKAGEKPNPESYTDAKYLAKIKENLTTEQVAEVEKEFEEKRLKATQVPFSYTEELASLPESVAFTGTKVGTGGMQLWDNISEKFGLQDEETSFERYKARRLVDTAQAKLFKAEPRSWARVMDTYYAPVLKSFSSLTHPSVNEYKIMYPELTDEEIKSKRQSDIEKNVIDVVDDVKKSIPESDPDIATFGSLTIPGQFGVDVFGYTYSVVQASKMLTPIAKLKLKKLLYTDDQINALEKTAQEVLKKKELSRLEGLQKPRLLERAAGATEKGIEKTGDWIERSPKFQKLASGLTALGGAALGYQLSPENALTSMGLGALGTRVGLKHGAKTLSDIPKVIKEVQAARRISGGGSVGPLATLKAIAKQQDEVKNLTQKLKTLSEGTDEYIETKQALEIAKSRVKDEGIVDYEGIGRVSDTTKRILRFANDDIVSNIGEYTRLGIEPTLVALATGAIDSADEEELKTMIGQGLVFSLGGRAVQQGYHKFLGEDPVIAARRARKANVDALKAYRDSTPETQGEIDKLTDWNLVVGRQAKKVADTENEVQRLVNESPDNKKIEEAEKRLEAEKKSLSLLKTANAQTRNEFGRQFLNNLGRNNLLLNGALKAGQNNIGIHILNTEQIFNHFRQNPALRDAPDEIIYSLAGQQGFFSGTGGNEFRPGMEVNDAVKNVVFDQSKPSIVINSDALRNRIEIYGETPIDALNHETGHAILRIKEIQDAVSEARKLLFSNQIKDAQGNVKAVTTGLYNEDQLIDLYENTYLKNYNKKQIEAIAKASGLWDNASNSINRKNVANYMQEEILADLFSNTLSRNLGRNIDPKSIHLLDVARAKLKNNLLKKATTKLLGLGLSGDIVGDASKTNLPPEAQSAARNALRLLESLNGDFVTIESMPETATISKADIRKSKIAVERYGMDSGLFATKVQAQVFDADGKTVGTPVDVTDPAVFEGTWRITKDGEERLNGYGQIPVELRQLQVPEGGTLAISKKIITEADGVTPKLLQPSELKKIAKDRATLFKQAIDTPDYGTPNRFEAVSEGSETYRGTFTPLQIKAIQALPEGIVPLKIKNYLLELNDAIVKKDGSRFYVDYAAVMDDKGNYKAFSPKIYDIVPIGLHLSKAGNFLVTTISVGRMMSKLNAWADRMPNRLSPWNGSKESFWSEFSTKYLDNWSKGIKGSGYNDKGEPEGNNQLSDDVALAEQKKSIFNDFLNLFKNETEALNLDRTKIPKRKGDEKNKSMDRTIMSMRIDHMAEVIDADNLPKLPIDYGKAIINFLPAEVTEIEAPSGERGFKSKLQTEIQRKFQGANATPEQLKAVLGNPQFVKPEEVKWSGVMDEIDRLAQENNGKVPVQELMNYLRDEGQVKFNEVTLGGVDRLTAPRSAERLRQVLTSNGFNPAEADRVVQAASRQENAYTGRNGGIIDLVQEVISDYRGLEEERNGTTKYSEYQLPGGENYREVVLSMPKSTKYTLRNSNDQIVSTHPDRDSALIALKALKETDNFANITPTDEVTGFTSSHFPEIPNYIAHMRVNERTDAEGNNGLFVEEFQSDRHQQGREKGYREDIPKPDTSKWRASKDGIEPTQSDRWRVYSPDNPTGALFTANSAEEAISRAAGYYGLEGIPDAPFRKDWGVQLFKRALRDAVDADKKWIGWTTGDTQAERYDLSKQIGKVVWNEDTKMLTAYDPSQKRTVIQESNITSDKLADYVGKEVAQKLVEQSPDDDMDREISGLDLKIGGEGMKGFYDQILPKDIGKYVAKMGGKVEKSGIDTGVAKLEQWMSGEEAMTMNGIPQSQHNEMWKGMTQQEQTDYLDSARKQKFKDQKKVTPIWRVNITPEMENVVRAGQIQFMPADSEYLDLAQDPEANQEQLQRMVDEAAKEAGYDTIKVYHGTLADIKIPTGELGVAAHISRSKKFAEKWANAKFNTSERNIKPPKVYEWYIKGEIFDPRNDKHLERIKEDFYQSSFSNFGKGEKLINKSDWKNKDYDFFERDDVIEAIKNAGFDGHEDREGSKMDWGKNLAIFDPNNIKSADPVTYDDAGNVIPLSQRFQTTSPDIRFMPAEQEPQGMEGVEAPQTYRRISDMIPPLQGVEPPVRGRVEEQSLSGLAFPAQELVRIPEISKIEEEESGVPELPKKYAFAYTTSSDRIPLVDALVKAKNWQAIRDLNQATIRHAMSDLPNVKYTLKDLVGAFENEREISVMPEFEINSPEELAEVRKRMVSLGELWQQTEVLEEQVGGGDQNLLGTVDTDGYLHIGKYVLTFDKLTPALVEKARQASGIQAMSYDNNSVIFYDTDNNPAEFDRRVTGFGTFITSNGRILENWSTTSSRVRSYRDPRSPKAGSLYYNEDPVRLFGEGNLPDRLRSPVYRVVSELLGRVLPPPKDGRASYFVKEDLTPKQVKLQNAIANKQAAVVLNDKKNKDVIKAYKELNAELLKQFDALVAGGMTFNAAPDYPTHNSLYPDSATVIRDIRNNNNLVYLKTTPDTFGPTQNGKRIDFSFHPLLKDSGRTDASGNKMSYNDILRVVHDAIAHGIYSAQFGPVGEESAWNTHIRTIDNPWARWALTMETRAQNSWVNYQDKFLTEKKTGEERMPLKKGDKGFVPVPARDYAEQKFALIPLKYTLTGDAKVDKPVKDLMEEIGETRSEGSPEKEQEWMPSKKEREKIYASIKQPQGTPKDLLKQASDVIGKLTKKDDAENIPVIVEKAWSEKKSKDEDAEDGTDDGVEDGEVVTTSTAVLKDVVAYSLRGTPIVVRPLPNLFAENAKTKVSKNVLSIAKDKDKYLQYSNRVLTAADKLRQDPQMFTTPSGYLEFMREAGASGNLLMPPSQIAQLVKDPNAILQLWQGGYHGKKTAPGTVAAAIAGLDSVNAMRDLFIEDGVNLGPTRMITALHHLWGILSRQLDPYNQEALWMRMVSYSPVMEQIQLSIDGKFKLTAEEWKKIVQDARRATKGDYQKAGNNATANANAFHHMLSKHNGKWQDLANIYKLSDPVEMTNAFWGLGVGATGIKNKVQRFIGLTFGIHGSVLDRWRFVGLNLPMAMGLTGKATPETYFNYYGRNKTIPEDPVGIYKSYGTVENGNPVFSTALYAGIDRTIQGVIDNSKEMRDFLGVHATPGGFHWVDWNCVKNEAVGHSSLDLTKEFLKRKGRNGTTDDFLDVVQTSTTFTRADQDGRIIDLVMKNGIFQVEQK